MKNNKLKKLENLKLRTSTFGLRNKLGIIAIVCLLIFAGYSGVNATIKLGNDGTTDWSMVDSDKIRTSNGKSFPTTGTGLQDAIWSLNSTGGDINCPNDNISITSSIYIPKDVKIIGSHNTTFHIETDVPFRLQGENISISNIRFSSSAYYSLWIYQDTSTTTLNNIQIKDCYFTGYCEDFLINLNTNIDHNYSSNIVIESNTFDNLIVKTTGVAIGTCQFPEIIHIVGTEYIVKGNIFSNCQTRRGICIEQNSTTINIEGNIFKDFKSICEDSWCIETGRIWNPSCINIINNEFFWTANVDYDIESVIMITQATGDTIDSEAHLLVSGNNIYSEPEFDKIGTGIWVHPQTNELYFIDISNNHIRGLGDPSSVNDEEGGILTHNANNARITDNTICNVRGFGIWNYGSDNCTISNNVLSNISKEGIVNRHAEHYIIANNVLSDIGREAIRCRTNPFYGLIDGNIINRCGYTGIRVTDGDHSSVINNKVTDASYGNSGVYLGIDIAGSVYVNVKLNDISDSARILAYVIRADGCCNNITITDNYVYGWAWDESKIEYDGAADYVYISNNMFNNSYVDQTIIYFPTTNLTDFNGKAGFTWFNSATNVLNIYNGTAWVSTTLT